MLIVKRILGQIMVLIVGVACVWFVLELEKAIKQYDMENEQQSTQEYCVNELEESQR